MNAGKGLGCLVAFALFWSVGIGLADGWLAWTLWRQVRAAARPTVPGRILESAIDVQRGDGVTYGVKVRYRYEVDGRAREGTTWRHGQVFSSDRRGPARVVEALPIGAVVPVHYDPANPDDAVLAPGVHGQDLFLALFLTPFNVIVAGVWAAVAATLRARRAAPDEPPVPAFERAGGAVLRLAEYGPLVHGAVAALVTSFVACLGIGLILGLDLSLAGAGVAWGLTLAATVYFAGRRWVAIERGDHDLAIDALARRLDVPPAYGRAERLEIDLDRVRACGVERIPGQGDDDPDRWAPTVAFVDGAGVERTERIVRWSDEGEARRIAAWLAREIGKARGKDVPGPRDDRALSIEH